jgi:Na+/H+-dicarboxylate symporter
MKFATTAAGPNRKSGNIILVSIMIGIFAGGLLGWMAPDAATRIKFIGDLFLKTLLMLVVPLIFVTMVHGVTQFGDVRKMGRPAAMIIAYYLLTTFISVGLGILVVNLIQPGTAGGAAMPGMTEKIAAAAARQTGVLGFAEDILNRMIPENIFASMAKMQVLPIIIFSVFFGAVVTTIGEKKRAIIELFDGLNETIMKMVQIVILAAPVGIACIVAGKLGSVGGGAAFVDELLKIAKYALTVITGLAIHGVIILPLVLLILGRRNPLTYAGQLLTPLTTAFSTASSSATLPITMESVEEAGVSKRSAGLVLPLGATINMDGTAMYEAVAAIFIAQSYKMDLTGAQQVVIFLTATLAGIGAAGIPEAGLVTMVMVLQAVGLPIEGIGLILAIDWFLDRCRTTVNVWGDMVGAAVIDRLTVSPH